MKITAVGISFIYIILGLENKNRLMNYLSIGCAVQVICSLIALALVPISADSPNLLTSSLFYFEIGAIVTQIFFLVGLSYKQRMELVDEIRFKEPSGSMKRRPPMKQNWPSLKPNRPNGTGSVPICTMTWELV